ncbi:TPA: hypothetical protein N0F65_012727 [Lagenidium giganteum]|uniref:Uncharacterized protein n=1 Tax=Lagenidium giganteum TaxID=4803 RepID=A0AAV2YA70_9STRA|nr:TPA: hypothetical protein N0F65_012727 [Lagenidium giganteum]
MDDPGAQNNEQRPQVDPQAETAAVQCATPPMAAADIYTGPAAAHRDDDRRGLHKRSRKGFSTRKRIGLKIDAELTTAASSGANAPPLSAGSQADGQETTDEQAKSEGGSEADAVPWWVLEYRCPPPGHLGAHQVPVADTKDSSPSQKRKITHVLERDSTDLSSMVTTKELKRFHESSTETPRVTEQPLAPAIVTPSNLVRPLNKIDLHGPPAAPSTAKSSASHAPESA